MPTKYEDAVFRSEVTLEPTQSDSVRRKEKRAKLFEHSEWRVSLKEKTGASLLLPCKAERKKSSSYNCLSTV